MKYPFVPTILFACLALGLLSPEELAGANRDQEPDARQTLAGNLTDAVGTIRIDNRFGPVTVTGVDSGFGWNWDLRCWADSAPEAEAYVKQCRLDVRSTGGTLELVLVLPDGQSNSGIRRNGLRKLAGLLTGDRDSGRGDRNIDSALQLRVPRAVTIDLVSRFGPVAVAGTRGSVKVDNQNGKVDLTDIEGAVTAYTCFATLHAERTGPANLRTQNGNLDARDIAGDLTAATSFARLRADGVKGQASLKNQNGEVNVTRVTGDLDAETSFAHLWVHEVKGRAELHNRNGGLDASEVDGDLAAATSFGDLNVQKIGGRAELKNQNGRIEAAKIGNDVTAANSFARIRVQNVHGRAELTGQNGEIDAAGVTGDIRAQTSFGRLRLDGTGRRFEAHNGNGAVEITARSPQVEWIDASASFHAIEVRLPAATKPLIDAHTPSGKVKSDFPVLLGDTLSDAKFAADPSPLKVTLRSQHGDIRIRHIAD